MSVLGKIFTWWNGATFGTMLDSARHRRESRPAMRRATRYFRAASPMPRGIPFAGKSAAG